jgi:hypothetical protein
MLKFNFEDWFKPKAILVLQEIDNHADLTLSYYLKSC